MKSKYTYKPRDPKLIRRANQNSFAQYREARATERMFATEQQHQENRAESIGTASREANDRRPSQSQNI